MGELASPLPRDINHPPPKNEATLNQLRVLARWPSGNENTQSITYVNFIFQTASSVVLPKQPYLFSNRSN